MCDYSLEFYQSRKAEAGDKLVTARFTTGSMGLTKPTATGRLDLSCATCVDGGTVMRLDLSVQPEFRQRWGFAEVEAATFVHLDTGVYRDGLRFENGIELSLQQIPCGVAVEVSEVISVRAPAVMGADMVPAE